MYGVQAMTQLRNLKDRSATQHTHINCEKNVTSICTNNLVLCISSKNGMSLEMHAPLTSSFYLPSKDNSAMGWVICTINLNVFDQDAKINRRDF